MSAINRQERARFGVELLTITAVGVLLTVGFGYGIYPIVGFPSTAPMPGRTVGVFLVVWVLMSKRGESWKELGLARPSRIWLSMIIALGLFLAKLLLVQPLADWVARIAELPKADRSFFDPIHGNLPAFIAWLGIAWVVGGFAEELVFRGFLMKRIASLFRSGVSGWAIALFVQAALFGAMHFYLGPAGVVSATLSALFLGLFFLIAGRNLWPVIFVHATWDSLAFWLIYTSGVPTI